MMSEKYGYGRVSTKEQNTDRQYFAFIELGVPEHNIFIDKQTGREFDRREYQRLLTLLKPSDLLIITSIDRLGRDYKAIQEQWRYITQEKQAHIRVIDMPILDTTNQKEGLLGVFICDLVLQILSYLSESTWENIKTNQRQGIERARQTGKHLGRPKKKRPNGFKNTYVMWKNGEITSTMAMKKLRLKKSTFYRMVKDAERAGMGTADRTNLTSWELTAP
ncbi:MAG: recombinase family protein [Oscillospiraceae bacterium]|nr:recombinase family protein [Oscillospiraceae bacterium]